MDEPPPNVVEPFEAHAANGMVVVLGASFGVTMTPEAALASAEALRKAAEEAQRTGGDSIASDTRADAAAVNREIDSRSR